MDGERNQPHHYLASHVVVRFISLWKGNIMQQLDLVQEMEWEDHVEFLTLEEAGLEEYTHEHAHGIYHSNEGSIYSYTEWFYDNDEDAFSVLWWGEILINERGTTWEP